MESKNLILAVVLSTLILVIWAFFFEPAPVERKIVEKQIEKNEDASSPSIEKDEISEKISRSDAINSVA